MLRLLVDSSRPSGQVEDDSAAAAARADKSRRAPPAAPKAPLAVQSGVPLREADWNRHRETITRLYWEENLPLHDVRYIMKQEHGFDASVKMYKKRLREWGVRKNIKSREAWEVASGQAHNPGFWPDARSSDYNHRISRHLKRCKHGVSTSGRPCPSCRAHRGPSSSSSSSYQLALTVMTTPAYTSKGLANVEMGLYYAEIFFQAAGDSKLSEWCSAPGTLKNLKFEMLFDQSLAKLARPSFGHEDLDAEGAAAAAMVVPQECFADINRAFDLLKSLIEADHPYAYHTLVSSMALCKKYPASDICFQVCRMLARQCQQLSVVILGACHPIHPLFAADLGMVEYGEASDFAMFLQGTRSMCVKYGASCL